MSLFWIVLAGAAALVGMRYRRRIAAVKDSSSPRVDDEALRTILEEGRLAVEEEEPLDLDEAARAEEEFWNEHWDEPDEFHP